MAGDEEEKSVLHWADYLVFVCLLMVSFLVGIYQRFSGSRQKTTSDYLMGNRNLSLIPTAASMFMSNWSAIFILGSTAEMYKYGTQAWVVVIGFVVASLVSAHVYVPLIWPLKITSNYEYHEMRYKSRAVRLVNTSLDLVKQVFYMGIAIYAPATALDAVVGLPVWACIISTGCLATIYTTVGGMRGVIWTDFIQGIFFFIGIIGVLIMGMISAGGISEVWRINKEHDRVVFFNFDPDPTVRMTFWTSTVGAFFLNTAAAASDQTSIQRYSSLPTLRKAKLAFLLQIPATFFMYLIANLIGMTVFAHYAMAGCDPLRSKAIKSANQLLPYYVLDVMGYPGFTGLFVSVLFSGALSSISSAINACAAITWKDFIDPHMPRIQESRKALLTKMLSLFYGSVAVCMAFVLTKMSGHIFQISQSVLGGIGGPMTGIIFLGSLFPCANWIGGLTGMLLGCAVAIWINFGHQIYTPWVEFLPTDTTNCSLPANFTVPPMPQNPEGVFWLYRVSFKYIGMIGCLVTVIVGLAVSFCTGATKPEDVDARTVVSLPSVGCCCCVPAAHRARCDCGVDHQKDGDGLSDDEKEIDTLMENKSDPVKTRISTM